MVQQRQVPKAVKPIADARSKKERKGLLYIAVPAYRGSIAEAKTSATVPVAKPERKGFQSSSCRQAGAALHVTEFMKSLRCVALLGYAETKQMPGLSAQICQILRRAIQDKGLQGKKASVKTFDC
eukprot:1146457-Pelagomonas_calceolata.AAC.1